MILFLLANFIFLLIFSFLMLMLLSLSSNWNVFFFKDLWQFSLLHIFGISIRRIITEISGFMWQFFYLLFITLEFPDRLGRGLILDHQPEKNMNFYYFYNKPLYPKNWSFSGLVPVQRTVLRFCRQRSPLYGLINTVPVEPLL